MNTIFKRNGLAAILIVSLMVHIIPEALYLKPPSLLSLLSQSPLIPLMVSPASAQRVGPADTCNCTIDTTSYGHLSKNISGITIPKVKLVKNESMDSQSEGHLTWKAIKPMQLMGILTNGYFLGNFSSGTSSTVALNTLNVKPNDTIGIQIGGGTNPTAAKAEIIKANVNANGTFEDIKTIGKTVSSSLASHVKKIKSALNNNKLLVGLDPHPSYYLLLVALTYGDGIKSASTIASSGPKTNHLVAIYQTVLRVS
jgi:hypothetical protein